MNYTIISKYCVPRESIKALKDGEDMKKKTYTALCAIPNEMVTDSIVSSLLHLNEMNEIKLSQRTPIRVLHRRYIIPYQFLRIITVNFVVAVV